MIGVDAERLSENGFEMPGQNFTEKKENIVNEYANQDSILFYHMLHNQILHAD